MVLAKDDNQDVQHDPERSETASANEHDGLHMTFLPKDDPKAAAEKLRELAARHRRSRD